MKILIISLLAGALLAGCNHKIAVTARASATSDAAASSAASASKIEFQPAPSKLAVYDPNLRASGTVTTIDLSADKR